MIVNQPAGSSSPLRTDTNHAAPGFDAHSGPYFAPLINNSCNQTPRINEALKDTRISEAATKEAFATPMISGSKRTTAVHSNLRPESVDEQEPQCNNSSGIHRCTGGGKQAMQGASRIARRLLLSFPTARVWWMTLLAVIGEASYGSATAGQPRAEGGPETPVGFDSGYDVARLNMIEAIAELYKEEMKRQEEMSMEDAILCDNGPKEISIFCHEAPEVRIVDIARDHRENNECLILNVNAPEVSSKIVLKCDGSIGSDEARWGEDW